MEIYPKIQAELLMWCALLGVAVCVLFRFVDAFLSFFKGHKAVAAVLRFVFDLSIVTLSGVSILLLSYYFNKGTLRMFAFLGFFVCFALTGKLLGKMVEMVFISILRILYKIASAFLSPFVGTFKILVNFLHKTASFMRKALAKKCILVYNIYVSRSILRYTRKGFGKRREK